MNIADTIAAGLPVEEQRTTRLHRRVDADRDPADPARHPNSTTLTTRTINLRNNGGTETVTDFSYASMTGTTVHVITTYLPDGSVQTENETVQTDGQHDPVQRRR